MSNRYKRGRELAGLSLSQAAAKLDWAKGPLHAIEVGSGRPPSADDLRRLADLYGVSVAWLQGSDPVVPEGTRKMLRDADISFAERDSLLELLGAIHTPEGKS